MPQNRSASGESIAATLDFARAAEMEAERADQQPARKHMVATPHTASLSV
jgi:hypothetical protein